MFTRLRYLLGGALALAAVMLATGAQATATVRVEWLKGGVVYSAENVTSSGVSASSGAMPDMGGQAGQARIVPIAGAAVVMHGLTAPVATQTNGVRLQVGQDPVTMAVQPGEKVAIIEATDALAATPVTGGTAGATTGAVTTAAPTYTTGTSQALSLDTAGGLRSTITNALLSMQGGVASGATDSGNPVKMGAKYNLTQPPVSDGQRSDLQTDSKGNLRVAITSVDASGTGAQVANGGSDAVTGGIQGLYTLSLNFVYNGTTFDRIRSIQGAAASGLGTTAVASAPTSSANAAIVPVVSSAVASSLVLKASAGNLYRVRVTSGATAGFLMLFNATSAPGDGAVTPQSCTTVPASSTVELDHNIPDRFSTGITAVFSSTGCFSKTASATAMFEGSVE